MPAHRFGDALRRGIVLAHAHDQGAQAARQQRGGSGRDHRAEVLAPLPHRHQQLRGAHQRSRGEIAVTAEILRRAVRDQVGAEFQRTLVHRRGERVVDRQQGAVGMRPARDRADVEHIERRVGGRLQEHQPRTAGQQGVEPLQLAGEQQVGCNPEQRQLLAQQFQRAAIGISDADDAIATVREEQGRFRRHPGAECPGHFRALEAGQRVFQRHDRGVHAVAGIKAARLAAIDHVEQFLGRAEGERGRVVDRNVRTAMRVPETLAVDAARRQALRRAALLCHGVSPGDCSEGESGSRSSPSSRPSNMPSGKSSTRPKCCRRTRPARSSRTSVGVPCMP